MIVYAGATLAGLLLVPLVLGLERVLRRPSRYPWWVLAVAGALLVVALWLPSPLVHGRDTAFTTHAAGGIAAGLTALHVLGGYRVRTALEEVLLVLALAAAMGVAVELLELSAVELGVLRLGLEDTSWDLLANTLGSLAATVIGAPALRRLRPAAA